MPDSLRYVQAALRAIQISSIHFTGSTPVVHGLLVIRAHRSVQSGSHWAKLSIAGLQTPRSRSASTVGVEEVLLIGAVLPQMGPPSVSERRTRSGTVGVRGAKTATATLRSLNVVPNRAYAGASDSARSLSLHAADADCSSCGG